MTDLYRMSRDVASRYLAPIEGPTDHSVLRTGQIFSVCVEFTDGRVAPIGGSTGAIYLDMSH